MCARVGRWATVFLALFSNGVAHSRDGGAIDPVWLAKAKTELKAVCDKHQALSMRLEEECEYRTEKAPGAAGAAPFRPQTRRERTVRLGDDIILEEVRILDGTPAQTQARLQCDNSAYYFTLSKSREGAPYALVEYALGKRKRPLITQGLAQGWHDEGFLHLRAALAAIEKDGKHTLRTLQFDKAKGLLRIEITSTGGNTPIEDVVYVDPSHDWRVVEHRVETPNLVGTDRWTYGVEVGGVEFPIGLEGLTTYKVANAPPNLKTTARVLSLKMTDKTPADFRLAAFGFPEPVDAPPPPKPTRWYLWILVAAGGCAALAVGFAYVHRRRQASRPSSPGQGEKL